MEGVAHHGELVRLVTRMAAGGWLVACDFAFARTRGSSAAIDPRRVEHRCVR
jgi:hypothetical protein